MNRFLDLVESEQGKKFIDSKCKEYCVHDYGITELNSAIILSIDYMIYVNNIIDFCILNKYFNVGDFEEFEFRGEKYFLDGKHLRSMNKVVSINWLINEMEGN